MKSLLLLAVLLFPLSGFSQSDGVLYLLKRSSGQWVFVPVSLPTGKVLMGDSSSSPSAVDPSTLAINWGQVTGVPAVSGTVSGLMSPTLFTLLSTAVQPSTAATTSTNGVIKQAAALSNASGGTVTLSTLVAPALLMAAAPIAATQTAMQNLTNQGNATSARLDQLITNLQSSGVLHP